MHNSYYSMDNDCDKIVRETYFPDFSYQGVMVEVGGGTPSFLSMSRHFKLNNWRCIIVEPNPRYAGMHRQLNNEIYEFACAGEDKDDVDFQVVHLSGNYTTDQITDQSYSAIQVKEGYLKHNNITIDQLPVINIKVKVRKLDTILAAAKLDRVDFLSIDVEGWELEVLDGFSIAKYQPKIILLENYLHDPKYTEYMKKFGYVLDKMININYAFIKAK
jgi:FkbM family methyltransferase